MPDVRPDWGSVWMSMADTMSARSKCDRAKVGCVIVSDTQSVLSASYNGPPPGYPAEGSCSSWCPRARGEDDLGSTYDRCPSAHAEANAVARADHSLIRGATAYVSRASCVTCAKLLAASGIARLVHRVEDIDMHRNPDATEEFLRKCGLTVERWQPSAATS
jgi:dCMP deaminase